MEKVKKYIFEYFFLIAGSVLFALGMAGFLDKAGISPGGFAGIAAIINRLTGLPTGATLFVINVPLLAVGFIKLGGSMIFRTLVSTFITSVAIDVFSAVLPTFSTDSIICALAGGVLMGSGMAMLFLHGSTSGGTDIAAKLLRRKYPFLSMGRLILILDAVIIGVSALVYGSMEAALYAVLAIIVSTTVIDKLMYGASGGKIAFIVTKEPEETKKAIFSVLKRGISEMTVYGGWSGEKKTMLVCAVRRQQMGDLQRILKQQQGVFVMLADAGEIMGNGFPNVE